MVCTAPEMSFKLCESPEKLIFFLEGFAKKCKRLLQNDLDHLANFLKTKRKKNSFWKHKSLF